MLKILTLINLNQYDISNILQATYETFYMSIISTFFVAIIGFILGVILFISKGKKTFIGKITYHILSITISILRAIPFIILIILLIPLSKLITGTILGPNAALPSLIIGLSPFYARMVETSLSEVDKGITELAISLGANTKNTILKFLLPESLPSLISNITNVCITMIGFSSISGLIGAGGLGDLAYLDGFERHNYTIIYICVIIILFMILIIQSTGNFLSKLVKK